LNSILHNVVYCGVVALGLHMRKGKRWHAAHLKHMNAAASHF